MRHQEAGAELKNVVAEISELLSWNIEIARPSPPGPSREETPAAAVSSKAPPIEAFESSTIDALQWRPYKQGHRAAWTYSDKCPPNFIEALKRGPIELGAFSYKLGSDPRFVSRTPRA